MDKNGIDYLGLGCVLKRGSGEVLEDREDVLFIRDNVSGAYMLACEEEDTGLEILERYSDRGYTLLMVSDPGLGNIAFQKYGFHERIVCYQVAYYGEKPVIDTSLTFRIAGENDLPMILEHYHLISPEELKSVIERGSLILGYEKETPVGFIGEHLEGSMGLLQVFPEFRKRGYGAALQKYLIARTMERGDIPFGQVEKENRISLNLQKKIGMTKSDRLIMWMWK